MIRSITRILCVALLVVTVLPISAAFFCPPALAETNDLNALHKLYNKSRRAGDYGEAERIAKRMLGITEKRLGKKHKDYAIRLNNLALVYDSQGRYADAIPLYKRALDIYQKKLGRSHTLVATTLSNLAIVYRRQAHYTEAIPLYKRALTIREKKLGPTHISVATTLNNLAIVYRRQARYEEAIPLYKRALTIREKKLGPTHPIVASTLSNLALVYDNQGRFAEAIRLYERALEIKETKLGPTHPSVATTVGNLAGVYRKQARYEEAIPLYKRALEIREKKLGRKHPSVAGTLNNLAVLYRRQDRYSDAISIARRAVQVLSESQQRAAATHVAEISGRNEPLNFINSNLVQIAYGYGQQEPSRRLLLAGEALAVAQRYNTTSASAALSQMAARLGVGDQGLGMLVREQQDLGSRWQSLDKTLIKTLAEPSGKRDEKGEAKLRQERVAVEARLKAVSARLAKDFPDYAELANPKPLDMEEVQRLLGPDEALVSYLVFAKQTYIWAVTRKELAWEKIEVGSTAFDERISAIREGLDIDALQRGEVKPVDLNALHDLHQRLLGPIEKVTKDKKHLLIVPSGALTSLPFHMLVTDTPKYKRDYAGAEWLIKRHAITTLPSVSSLRALRVLTKGSKARNPLIGYGDPWFGGPGKKKEAVHLASTRGYAAFFRGVRPDRDALLQSLSQLPGTRKELKAVAKSLGVPDSEIMLGKDASEEAVKKARLDKYRIVYFATHGLVAGDIKGLGEPALAFTIPDTQTDLDDGLLVASEVAQLKLDADWVVLSACNTAAGDKPGAEALSGLARAFFYAGARALLVTHWATEDTAAARLTSQTFANLAANPEIGRSQALRHAMLGMIADKSKPANANPALWAPFVVVGEGGVPVAAR